jgi:hypothetical protein
MEMMEEETGIGRSYIGNNVLYRVGIGLVAQLHAVITTLWLDQFLDFTLIPAAGCVRWCGCFRAFCWLKLCIECWY